MDPAGKRKDGMIRDFLSRWGRVTGPEKGICRACGSRLVSEDRSCPVCGIPPEFPAHAALAPERSPLRGVAARGGLAATVPPPEMAPSAHASWGSPSPIVPRPEPAAPTEAPAVPEPVNVPPAEGMTAEPARAPPPPQEPPAAEPAVAAPEAAGAGVEPGGMRHSPEKELHPEGLGAARCSVCDAEVPPDATRCPSCGATFAARPGKGTLLKRLELPPEKPSPRPGDRLRALKDAIVAGACPTCGAPVPGGTGSCPLCGTELIPGGELEAARRLVVESVRAPSKAPLPPAPARPFELPEDEAEPVPLPEERRGEELEIAKSDTDWQAWLVQGDIWYNAGQVQKAIGAYDRSLEIHESFEACNNKGLMLYRVGRLEESLVCFERALRLQPEDEFIWYNRGNALRDLGRFRECIESYDRAISIKPDFEKAWVASGTALLAEGRTEDAVICFEAALKINWDNEQTWHAIGSAMFHLKRNDEAEMVLNKAVEIRPDFWQAWYDKARLAIEKGKVREAVEALRKVTEYNPAHWRAWLELGGLYADLGEDREAVKCHVRAAELNPESWEAWRALGREYFSLKLYDRAATSLARATALNSRDGALWLETAECQYIMGDPAAAILSVQKALDLEETPEAWLSKGVAHAALGEMQDALECFRKGIDKDPASPRLWFELASAQRLLGEMEKAVQAFGRAIELNPIYDKAVTGQGRVLMDLGRTREALDSFEKAVQLRPSLDKLESIAELRHALILAEAAKQTEKEPVPTDGTLSREKLFRLGMGLGAPGGPEAGHAASPVAEARSPGPAPSGPIVQLEEPEALIAEAVPATEGPPAPAAPAREAPVLELTYAPGPPPLTAGALAKRGTPSAGGIAGMAPSAPLVFEPVDKALVSRRLAGPAIAAARLETPRGLTNGKGLINGGGLVNGRGRTNGLQIGRSITNGKGLVNGRSMVNGGSLVNGRGIINGQSLINGNGVINGRGAVSGHAGNDDGAFAESRRRARRGRNIKLAAGVLISAFLLLAIPFFALQFMTPKGIQIDGDFSDWEATPTYRDPLGDQTAEPSVNLLNYSTARDSGWAFFLVRTEGRVLEGANGGVDTVRIFVDTDSNALTGYRIAGIGADRMMDIWGFDNRVRGAELSAFNSSRSQWDWDCWNPVAAGMASCRGTGLEAGAPLSALGVGERGNYLVSILLDDGRDDRDFSDRVISDERGALTVEQSGLAPSELENLSLTVPVLRLELTSEAGEVPISSLVLEPLGASADRPTAISNVRLYLDNDRNGAMEPDDPLLASAALVNGTFTERLVTPLEVRPGGSFTLLAAGSFRKDAAVGSPVGLRVPGRQAIGVDSGAATLAGAGNLGFVVQPLPRIVIDGFFDDWAGVEVHNDSAAAANPDIDIQHYATVSDRDDLSFYLDVRGRMLGGTDVPASARARPSKLGPIGPPAPEAPLPLPVVTGVDTAAIFIDADQNASTGIPVGGLGADFSIQITGRDGAVLSSEFYRAGPDWNWTPGGAVPSGIDDRRLETQVSLGALGIPPSSVDVVMYSTDWAKNRDYTPEGRGRGGELSVSAWSLTPPALLRDTAWPMLALAFTATGSAVQLSSVDLLLLGTATGPDAPRAYLFNDSDGDGLFSANDTLLAGSGGDLAGRNYHCVPFTPLLVPEGGTRLLFVALEISAVATGGKTTAVSVPGPSSLGANAVSVNGTFPLVSETGVIAEGGGRSAPDDASPEPDMLHVSMYIRAKRLGGVYGSDDGASSGRSGPTGGWPSEWTLLTSDSNNLGSEYGEIDIRHLSMTDNSDYIYINISLQNMTNLHVNDEWNFYFQTNSNSTDTSQDMWYRVSLRCVNDTAPFFNATLSSYVGNANPPGRGNSWTTNETSADEGYTTDGTAFGYWYDKTNTSLFFYVCKSRIWGNLLGPGNTTSVLADTWYTNSTDVWTRTDRTPNKSTSSYTMVPEFGETLVPVAGVIVMYFAVGRVRRSRRERSFGASASRGIGHNPRAMRMHLSRK